MWVHPWLVRTFNDYQSHHQTVGNKVTHMVGIPLIVLSLFGLLNRVELFEIPYRDGFYFTAALLLYLVANTAYIAMAPVLGVVMALVTAVLLCLATQLPLSVCSALFIVGWVLQFIGHYIYEKKSPSFYSNAAHLVVGPLYILKVLLRIKN